MPVLRQWNGTAWLDVMSAPANMMSLDGIQTVTALKTFLAVALSGLPGATSASRYVGATVSGPPITGTFSQGDWVIAQDAGVLVCATGGTPGVWQATDKNASNRMTMRFQYR